MKKLKFDKFIVIFLFLQPILDVITSLQVRNNISITVGAIVRGILFTIILVYLYKNNVSKKPIIIFLIYVFLALSYQFLYTSNSIFTEVFNILKIFYLPFLIYFFNKYNNEKIDDKMLTIIYLIYINLIIIPYLFSIGYSSYSTLEDKQGYIGLFYSGNEISSVIIGLLPIVLNYTFNSKSYILKILVYIETLITVILIGTKTLFFGLIIIILYVFIKYLYKSYKSNSKNFRKILLIPIIFIVIMILILPKTPVYKNIKITLNYYNINSVEELLNIKSIDNVIFSKRLSYLENVNKNYIKEDTLGLIYGLGSSKISTIRDVEIDIFDIFYSIGIFGFTIWLILMINSIRGQKLRGVYKFSFILFLVMSLFSGHVLIKPMVSIYVALIFILNKNAIKIEKKKILLVSNMYPSDKYKHYGSFVKNTKELLEENNFIVDKSVMYKQDNFIKKIISYLSLYIGTVLKGIFNNYDYIYVHFVSHSSPGAVFLKLTSRDVKLVLNAHGNDVVKDADFDDKNIRRSKKYIKYADKVIVPSNYFKDIMINDYKVDENIIFIYPSGGVNTDKFIKLDKEECKKKCNLSSEHKYIGYISRIEKDKGWEVFLKAIKELEKENKIGDRKFLIIGTGTEENDMNELIKELDILKYLEIRSMVSQDELVNIYNSLEIFVFPTHRKSESLGLVGLEAMACETFVIASNNYGPTDYVRDNKNGFLFKPQDEIDLKNKILEYENLNNEQKKKISKKMRETAVKYDTRNTKDKILEVFR